MNMQKPDVDLEKNAEIAFIVKQDGYARTRKVAVLSKK